MSSRNPLFNDQAERFHRKTPHLLAIRYQTHPSSRPDEWLGPVKVGTFDFENFFWGGWGPGYMVLRPGQFEVLCEFKVRSYFGFRQAFTKMFPPPIATHPVRSEGWISPKGVFYTCKYGDHDSLADDICIVKDYRPVGQETLLEKGWLSIHANGLIYWRDYDNIKVTPKQLALLHALYACDDDKDWRHHLHGTLVIRLKQTLKGGEVNARIPQESALSH